ncbi:unnamed protein product [Effrenium voratum]|uniref:Uncharacterized protein n=1 Tax=Effrenium voratum TaxID=2562239 RepID=A0AA36JEM7_9DINO|nr:unnamed protein product [Effrenium voratum]
MWALESYGGLAVSVLVLVAVELACRSGQVQLAAAAAAIPTGLPLALIIVASKAQQQEEALVSFSEATLRGAAGTLGFAVAMLLAARRGWGVPAMLLSGYSAWFATWLALSALKADADKAHPGSRRTKLHLTLVRVEEIRHLPAAALSFSI